MMRIAACLATERGIEVCAPVHDAFLICAPIERIDDEVSAMRSAMIEASRTVLDGFELRVDMTSSSFRIEFYGPPRRGDVGQGDGSDRQAPANGDGGVMAANRDPIDMEALQIDPADPALVPRSAGKTRKKKWERKFIPSRGRGWNALERAAARLTVWRCS